jgi:hypothetical protein
MIGSSWKFGVAALAAFVVAFSGANDASATVFCAPDTSFAGCPLGATDAPGSGSDSIETAMASNGSDGIADTVHIAPGTFVNLASYEADGTDDLTVIGSGREQTVLTSSSTSNIYLLELNSGNSRDITVRNLTLLIPASFPDGPGYGAGVQATRDSFESVDLVTENNNSYGFSSMIGGGKLEDVRVSGRNGARFARAIDAGSCSAGQMKIDRSSFASATYGLAWSCPSAPVTVDRTSFAGVDMAISAANGAQVAASNLLIQSGDLAPVELYNSAGAGTTKVTLNHATIVATGDASMPAVRAKVANTGSATSSIELGVSNSIITGFAKSWDLEAPVSGTLGNVSLAVRYSLFDSSGVLLGDVSADQATGNISGNPGFAGINDFHLSPTSSAVDAGDPAAALPAVDLDGAARPVDGNGDGSAIRDMGAYEAAQPVCPLVPSLCGPADTTKPKISKYKFSYRVRKGGSLKFKLSEAASVSVVFTPTPKKTKNVKKRKTYKITRKLKKGSATIKLGKGKLKKGRYKLKLVATDAAGNKSKTLSKTVKVK